MDSADLSRTSREWMQAGFAAFVNDDGSSSLAVHHAGVAIEHLLKAYLSSLHPALIVDPKNLESLLHAVGLGDHAQVPVTQVRTIGLEAAFQRTVRLIVKSQKLTITDASFRTVCEARNGVAHIG